MKIGAQLYTLRDFCQNEEDFRKSMSRVSSMGYKVVQLSAIGDIPPENVRKICDDAGLEIALTHTKRDLFHNIEDVISAHKTYGCKYVGIGMGDRKYFTDTAMDAFSPDYRPACETLHNAGMHFMYHTHCMEFAKAADGRYILEHFLAGLSPEICGVTLDLYWLQFAGCDVFPMLDALQNRIPCVHLKDASVAGFTRKMVPVGEGNMDYARIMDKLVSMGKTEYAFVEQDDCNGEDPFSCMERSYDFLRKWDE